MPDIRNTIRQWRWKLKGAGRELGMLTGHTKTFFRKARGQRILVYHGVCQQDHLRFNTLFVTQRMFERQLQLFKEYFHLLSLDEYYAGKFSEDRFNVCLSFDDGFANNHKYVLPLLEKYEVPAVFFITGVRKEGYDILWNDALAIARQYGPHNIETGGETFIKNKEGIYQSVRTGAKLAEQLRLQDFDTKRELIHLLEDCKAKAPADYWLQLTTDEIRSMAANKWVTVGAHGLYHNDLAALSPDKVGNELQQVKRYLEELCDRPVKSLAFPYGSYTNSTVQLAKKEGFTQLLAGMFNNDEQLQDEAMRERLTINPYISAVNQLHATIKGHYD
ncbi:MAG: polysaccharide deacetylase family protein [Chitinophagaceae bacterium]|nr:polysaccharide deacetylase family protein [Chitinophagaceae bacterium]